MVCVGVLNSTLHKADLVQGCGCPLCMRIVSVIIAELPNLGVGLHQMWDRQSMPLVVCLAGLLCQEVACGVLACSLMSTCLSCILRYILVYGSCTSRALATALCAATVARPGCALPLCQHVVQYVMVNADTPCLIASCRTCGSRVLGVVKAL